MRPKSFTILTFLLLFSAVAFTQSRQIQLRPDSRLSNSIKINQIELFPNPASDFIFVKIKDSNLSDVKIELRSMIGNRLTIDIEKVGINQYRIPLKNFATGYYFVVVKDEFSRFNKAYKILKK